MLVKFVNPPKEGKKLGNLKMATGETIFFDPKDFSFTAGKEYALELGIFGDGARIVKKVLPDPVQQSGQTTRVPDVAANLSEPELRFISNVVGQAILAKTITDPLEVSVWAKAAKQTLKELI